VSEDTITESDSVQQRGADEVFCTECGSVIKKQAEICPECGVSQTPGHSDRSDNDTSELSERRQYELEKVAAKSKLTVMIVGILISPAGYWMVGKKALSIINLLTLNFFFLGLIIVPIHCYVIIGNAQKELQRAGVGGY
jgi:uncharacterized membrane protein YvbJ